METLADCSRCRVPAGSIENCQYASSTSTWAIVIESGPPLTTSSSIWFGAGSSTRCTLRVSIGGTVRSPRPASVRTIKASTAASSSRGTTAQMRERGEKPVCRSRMRSEAGAISGSGTVLTDIEDPHPAELGEFGDVGVEHIVTRLMVLIGELQNAALSLRLHDRIDRAQRRLQPRAGVVIVEEIGVQMEGVDQVELGDIDQVDAHRPRAVDLDGVLHIMEGHRVDRVDLVSRVEGGVEGVHHHDELLPHLRLDMVGVPRFGRIPLSGRIGVDDVGAVEPLVDVPFQRGRVAVVEVAAERFRVELVDELLADLDLTAADAGDPVLKGTVDTVEVHGVGVSAGIREVDTQPVPLVGAQGRSRDLAVVGPGREEDAGGDLDLL